MYGSNLDVLSGFGGGITSSNEELKSVYEITGLLAG